MSSPAQVQKSVGNADQATISFGILFKLLVQLPIESLSLVVYPAHRPLSFQKVDFIL